MLSPRADPSRSDCPPRVYVSWGLDTMGWLSFNQVMLGVGEPSTSQGSTVGKPSTTDTSEVSLGPLMVGGAGEKDRQYVHVLQAVRFFY